MKTECVETSQVIELEPKNEINFYKRFRVYLRQQKLKEALADLNSALTINPEYEVVLVQRAKLQIRMGRCEEALNDYNRINRFELLHLSIP